MLICFDRNDDGILAPLGGPTSCYYQPTGMRKSSFSVLVTKSWRLLISQEL